MKKLLKPQINQGEYVFVLIDEIDKINQDDILCSFKENGKYSLIVKKDMQINTIYLMILLLHGYL